MLLTNKIAIVTGGGSGIGKAIAMCFAQEGAKIVLADVTTESLKTSVGEIERLGLKAIGVPTDVKDEEQVNNLVKKSIDEFGRIDILVNNVGIAGPTASLIDLNTEDWNNVLAVNLTGTMMCTREVLKYMIPEKSGSIVNISSDSGKVGTPLRSPYCATKWAIIGLTQTWAMEVGQYNIRVNCICPGWVEGPRVETVLRARSKAMKTSYEDQVREKMNLSPLRRFVRPNEVGWTAVFLVSDKCTETGQALNVSSGVEMR